MTLPEAYNGETAVPLVVILHFGSPEPTPAFYGQSILVGLAEPALRDLGAIIAAPDCNAGQWNNRQSEKEVLELIDYLEGEYLIDARRILLSGYSLGGIGTWYIGSRNQDRFAAAIPMAAGVPPAAADAKWHIPLYVIHGRQDELFPWPKTQEAVDKLRAAGVDIELHVLDGATHYDTEAYVETLRASVPWIKTAWEK